MLMAARNAMTVAEDGQRWWGLTFTAKTANTTIGMTKVDTPPSVTLEKSTDGGNTWASFDPDGGSVTLAKVGAKVCFRAGTSGNTGFYLPGAGGYWFTIPNGSAAASGNIMSLLTQNENDWQSVTMADYCFGNLFSGCTGLTSAPDLPAMTLALSCYSNMFHGCTGLTSTPALPATELERFCYGGMFWDCTSLTSVAAFPVATLAEGCYNDMFHGCTGLTSAPALPAITLAKNCYQSMFEGCTSLTSAPTLPVTTLEPACYNSMFKGCTSLASAPALPATTLEYGCYSYMFQGCTGLASAPALPATTLAGNCYYWMFSECTSLTSAPALPATTLASQCYGGMFYKCTGLTSAPVLPATTLETSCYYYMFSGCTSLNSISVGFTTWPGWQRHDTMNWLEGVAASGTFICPSTLDTSTRDASHVPSGWTVSHYWGLTFTAESANTTIGMAKTGTPPSVTLEKSTDGGSTWTSFDPNGGSVTLANIGDKVCFRAGSSGNTRLASSSSNYYKFTIPAGSAAASGNIMSLLTQNEGSWQSVQMGSFCYSHMFSDCASLAAAPALPATTLADYCYDYMFKGCTSLTSAPALPATTLANSCYHLMFQGCTSLMSAPALSATTLVYDGYFGMFSSCTSLTSAPALPATTLASFCYASMFNGCTSLTSAPSLPATTLASGCYDYMFKGCTSLASVEVAFTNWNMSGDSTSSWLANVASSGTFTCPSALDTTTRDASHVPSGWTVVNPSS